MAAGGGRVERGGKVGKRRRGRKAEFASLVRHVCRPQKSHLSPHTHATACRQCRARVDALKEGGSGAGRSPTAGARVPCGACAQPKKRCRSSRRLQRTPNNPTRRPSRIDSANNVMDAENQGTSKRPSLHPPASARTHLPQSAPPSRSSARSPSSRPRLAGGRRRRESSCRRGRRGPRRRGGRESGRASFESGGSKKHQTFFRGL